jgi:hypothetical protein
MTGQNDLRKIQLKVNRSFYVNAKPDVDSTNSNDSSSKSHAMITKSGVRVTRQLPHGRPAHHLIQVCTYFQLDNEVYTQQCTYTRTHMCTVALCVCHSSS